jgi:hypothetical protein
MVSWLLIFMLCINQSKLHQIHVVVIQNRLEQLRQKQRTQALRVPDELGGTITNMAIAAATEVTEEEAAAAEEEEEIEEYSREMSPELLDPASLPQEDRKLPIVDEEDELRALVREMESCGGMLRVHVEPHFYSLPLVISSHPQISCLGHKGATLSKTLPHHLWQILQPSVFTKTKQPRTWTRTKNFSTWKKAWTTLVPTVGKTSSDRENRDSSTECIRVSSGTNTTRRITSKSSYTDPDKRLTDILPAPPLAPTILLPRLCKVTNSTFSTQISCKHSRPLITAVTEYLLFPRTCSDKTVTPSYKFVRDKSDPDTCLLVFTAGPPYEDIAFRIVDKEWEYSHKR